MHMPRASGRIAGALTAAGLAVGLLTFAGVAGAQSPLEPVDTSSPRATFESFLALTDESSRRYNAFRENPGPATERAVRQLSDKIVRLFDLTDVAPAARMKTAAETYYLLWDVTARLELPELTEIPDEAAVSRAAETRSPIKRWRIPDTDITIARVEAGEREGEFLFSPDTVARAPSYHEAMLGMPYLRPTAAQNVYGIYQTITGWMIPPAWVEKLPEWTLTVVAGQVLWKWLALLLLSGLAVWAGVAAVRWSVRGEAADDTSSSFMRRLSAPVAIFLLAELLWLLALRQINVTGFGAGAARLAARARLRCRGRLDRMDGCALDRGAHHRVTEHSDQEPACQSHPIRRPRRRLARGGRARISSGPRSRRAGLWTHCRRRRRRPRDRSGG